MNKLDEEIARYLREECSADDEPTISEIAKHFAEWQREQMEDEHGKALLYVCQKTAEREHRRGVRNGKAQVISHIRNQVKLWMPDNPEGDEYIEGKRLAFRSVLVLLDEMEGK